MNPITYFSLSLLSLPISSAADVASGNTLVNNLVDRTKSIINDPVSSINSIRDGAEGFFNDQLDIDGATWKEWYSSMSEEAKVAYGKIQDLIESKKAQVSKDIHTHNLNTNAKRVNAKHNIIFRQVT